MKKDTRKRFTLRMPLELYNLIEVGADATGTSANAFILQILWKWVEQFGGVMKIDEETLYCAAMHIKAYHRQSICNEAANFGEPCAKCKYAKSCQYDWFAKMQPLFKETGEVIQLCH